VLHPIMPFITEEIWQAVAPMINANKVASIMLANFPVCTKPGQDCSSLAVDRLQQIIATIRNMRSQNSINPRHKLAVVLVSNNLIQDKLELQQYNHHICVLAKLECIIWQESIDQENYISHTLGNLTVNISKDSLNVDASLEKDRLNNLIRQSENKLIKLDKKLSNPLFISKAPAHIVQQVQKERDALFESVNKYKQHLLL
jgi:valyl-tRNA synthetase